MTISTGARPGRNEPCHCGSGKKYKQCHLEKDEKAAMAARAKAAAAVPEPTADTVKTSAAAATPKHKTDQPWRGASTRGFVRSTVDALSPQVVRFLMASQWRMMWC